LPAKNESVVFSADSRWAASYRGNGRSVKVWDAATGREAFELAGHMGSVDCAAFSPQGTHLATGSWDTTALIWKLVGRFRRPAVALPAEERDALWEALADVDPAKAQRALGLLADAGSSGVTFLIERLKPARPDPEVTTRARELIAALDSDRFE